MKKCYSLTLLVFTVLILSFKTHAQNAPIDFETGGFGADFTWTVFEADTAPLEIVANPDNTGINTSTTAAKMTLTSTNANYAGAESQHATDLGTFTFDATNSIVKIMVYKSVISEVRLKFVTATSGSSQELIQTNTLVNQWEELTFDFSGDEGTEFDQIVVFTDFNARTETTVNYFDNISFEAQPASALLALPLDFESAPADYLWVDFDGGATTVIANPQSSGINTSTNVAQSIKGAGEAWGGSSIDLKDPIDFSVNKTFKMKVFAPAVGDKVLLKVENSANADQNHEVEVLTTVANEWEELTFDYSTINTANPYDKIVIIFQNGTVGDGSAAFTYLFDDINLVSAGGSDPTKPVLPLDFETAAIDYTWTDFDGGTTTVIANPQSSGINTSATVAQSVKGAGEAWGGSFIQLSGPINFSVNKTFKMKVFAPAVGDKVLLKVEDSGNADNNFESEVVTTLANEWEELTFDYANINTANNYDKIVIIFQNGTVGDGSAAFTYLFDDINLVGAGGSDPTKPVLPLDFETAAIDYTWTDFDGGTTTVIANPQSSGINTSATVAQSVKGAGEAWGGSFIQLSGPIDFSVNKTFKMKVFAPAVGDKVLLKVEDSGNADNNFESEVVTTLANEWEELTFDYANINTANNYDKIVIIFQNGTVGDGSAAFTYLFDDINLVGAGGSDPTKPVLPLDFETAAIDYTWTDFDGGATTVIANPQSSGINTSATVAQSIKGAGEAWGGSFIQLSGPIDFSVNKTFKMKVFAPAVGDKVLLKVEDSGNADNNFESEVVTTLANEWEELTFDYANINTANNYDKIVIIFQNGTVGDGSAAFTYLFDEISLVSAVALNTDATLSDLQVDEATIAGFSAATLSYTMELPFGETTVPTVTATATDNTAATVEITPATALPGTTEVLVTAEDGSTTQTYTVEFTLAAPATDASLSDLQVDNVVVEGFAAATFDYSIELPAGITTVPTVDALSTDPNASVEITPATALPGTTEVLVTAEDGTTTQTYTISFTVSTVTGIDFSELYDLTAYSSRGILYVNSSEKLKYGRVELYSINGNKILSKNILSNEEQFKINNVGIVILQILDADYNPILKRKLFAN